MAEAPGVDGKEDLRCLARPVVAMGDVSDCAGVWVPVRVVNDPVGLSLSFSLSFDDEILFLRVSRKDLVEPCVSVLTIGTVSLKFDTE